MSDAIQMFNALKMNGVDSRIALFHGENHELSPVWQTPQPHLALDGDWQLV